LVLFHLKGIVQELGACWHDEALDLISNTREKEKERKEKKKKKRFKRSWEN
jgi:hypothetical protein